MKYKLIATCAASALLVACNTKDKAADKTETDTSTSETQTDTGKDLPSVDAPASAPVEHSLVSGELTKVTKIFNGTEYVSTELSGAPEYFILYYTASW